MKGKPIWKILKKRTTENETIYIKYKYLFEKIKKKSKASYYQHKLNLFEGDIKKTWKIIKEVIEKKRGTCDSFPKTLIIEKVDISDTKTIANSFWNFFVKSCITHSKKGFQNSQTLKHTSAKRIKKFTKTL